MPKISWELYFLQIAQEVSKRSSCSRHQYGAVVVRDKDILATGYNGTPSGTAHCDESACPRCSSEVPHGASYADCICVHAEENAFLRAARIGVSLRGSQLYVTGAPCLGCVMMAIQVGVLKIIHLDDGKVLPVNQEALKRKLCQESGMVITMYDRLSK